MSEPVTVTKRSAGLFDLRYVLALLFVVYGAVLTVMGLVSTSQADLDKAAGININLWGGVVMLVVGILFALWARLRPIVVPVTGTEPADDATGAGES
jgi:xanthine/uracil/vitamin C permease (AzgA family)